MTELDEAIGRLRLSPRDPGAWERLFSATWPYVLALAHRHLAGASRAADAEDLAQEVFLKLSRAWHARQIEVHEGNGLNALLAVMTRRLAADAVRREHRSRRDVSKTVHGDDVPEPTGGGDGLWGVQWGDLLDVVSRRLTDEERRALELRIQGYQAAEIATLLDVAVRTVERKLNRVRELLRPHLELEA